LETALHIAKTVQTEYQFYKAFVIFSSYEEMEYLSTGLSLICKNLRKLILFTGGFEEISRPNSDSATNLSTSLTIANNYRIPEVTIFHNNLLLRANRVIRTKCEGNEIFKSLNYPPLATTANQDISIIWENILNTNTVVSDRMPLEIQEVDITE
jgi:L-asparaginase